MQHITDILSKFVAELNYEDLTAEAVEQTKLYIADYYAACYAGHLNNAKFSTAVEELLYDMGGKKEASVLFCNEKLPVANAAFMNAVYAHGADMDDGNKKAMGHVAAHVMSTVFALAETKNSTWKEIFVAINVGYEIYNRVAAAVQPGLVHRGFHSTGTAGAIACGAVAAKLMKMDADGIYNTMALCAIQASGLIIIAESGQCCKPINPANAAKTGIISAKLISSGIESARYPLESQKGWFHAMSDEVDESVILNGLGKEFTICDSYLKPYPSCRHTHCGIEAALKIRKRILDDGKSISIKKVNVYIYQNAITIAGKIHTPVTCDDSKFSIHYSLAMALSKGHFGLSDLSLDNLNTQIKDLINKTELIPDESMENRDKGIRGAKVEVVLSDGSVYSETVLVPKGDRVNPFSWDDMSEKMVSCMTGYFDKNGVEKIISNIMEISPETIFTSIKNI